MYRAIGIKTAIQIAIYEESKVLCESHFSGNEKNVLVCFVSNSLSSVRESTN